MAAVIHLAHVCSSDLSIPALMPFNRPLLERGWRITFVTPSGPHVESGRAAGLEWRPFALRRRMHPPSDVVGAIQLARYCRLDQYQIVHTHNIKAGQIGRVVAAAMRVPIVVHTIHGMAYSRDTPRLKRRIHATLEKVASVGCDCVMTQSREDYDTYLADQVIARERMVVIGNGIELSRFNPSQARELRDPTRRELGLAPDDILFLSAGRLIVEKGFVELFDAAARARAVDPRVRVAIAGAGDERSDSLGRDVLERARSQGVLLLGRRTDMPALYAASDVVTLPSWHEGMPRVLMEGAAMGKPLLATDVVGCREVCTPEAGILVPVRDPEALAHAMLRLAAAPEQRAVLGQRNAEFARTEYAIHAAVDRVLATYDRLIAERGLR